MEKLPVIAIVGYGQMGRKIEELAAGREIPVGQIFDKNVLEGTHGELAKSNSFDFDVAIDFTYPGEVMENIKCLARAKKNIVIGTTGWHDEIDEAAKIADDNGIGIIYGTNFSIEMQALFRIARYSSRLVNKIGGFDIMIHEMHHKRKKDSPSGSALSLANIILNEMDSKKEILAETAHEAIRADQLHVTSTRGGEIAGAHSVYIDSEAGQIELKHSAKGRSGFAQGALEAAKWIFGKKGFYSFDEMLDEIWGKQD